MRSLQNKKSLHIALAAFMAVSSLYSVFMAQHAHAAAALNQTFVRFDRIAASTITTGTVCARPTTTSTDVKTWSVTFPTGFVLGVASTFQLTNINTTSTNYGWPGGVTPSAWPNAALATAGVAGQVVTWTNSSAQTMNSGTTYCYNWLNTTGSAVTTPGAATSLVGSISTFNSSAVAIDSGQYATSIITNDQIVVTASVPPTFVFSLSGNTDDIGALTAGTVKPGATPRTATVSTNSKNGWMVWGKDTWTGMKSATASYTVASTTPGTNSTLTGAAEGYNTGVTYTVGTGSVTVDPAFVGGSLGKGGGLDVNQRLMASGAGVTSNAVLTLTNNMNVLASTPAATDYTDTLTVTGAGLF
jgi:hypothetical protein